jgi:hypothetical protein
MVSLYSINLKGLICDAQLLLVYYRAVQTRQDKMSFKSEIAAILLSFYMIGVSCGIADTSELVGYTGSFLMTCVLY